MKENELDDLFGKARREQAQTPAEDILKKLEGVKASRPEQPYGKAIKLALLGILIVAAGLSLLFINRKGQTPGNDAETEFSYRHADKAQNNFSDSLSDSLSANAPDTVQQPPSDATGTDKVAEALKKAYNNKQDEARGNSKPHKPEHKPEMRGDLADLLRLQQKPAQVFEIDCSRDTVLTAAAGSRFYIESETFCRADGQALRTGNVLFEVKECYSPADMVRENLSTASDYGLLETGGMFHMLARSGKDTLQIRRGYEIGFRPAYKTPERMLLWYGNRDSSENIRWTNDSLGKRGCPVFIALRGKYGSVFNPYFYKNYKLSKEAMLALQDTGWDQHLTAEHGQLLGSRSCREESGPFYEACEAFAREMAPALIASDKMGAVNRMSDFSFYCMSKQQYAFGLQSGRIDSFRHYVLPDGSSFDLNMPVFFSRYMGWNNMDCINRGRTFKKKTETLSFTVPMYFRSNAILFLPEYGAVSRLSNIRTQQLSFDGIPVNTEAVLIVTALHNEKFYVYKQAFNSSAAPSDIAFETMQDPDTYLNWIEEQSSELSFRPTD